MKKLFLLAFVAICFTAVSFGQNKATANANATVKDAVSIAKDVDDLNFGSFAAGATTGGKVTVFAGATTASITGTNNVLLIGTVSSAKFKVSGPSNQSFGLTLPQAIVTLKGTADPINNIMTIATTDWNTLPTALTALSTANGIYTFYVGGALTFAINQPKDIYTATFEIRVDY